MILQGARKIIDREMTIRQYLKFISKFNMKKLKNILITGSSSGIGWKIAQILSKNKNNNIIINDRNLKN